MKKLLVLSLLTTLVSCGGSDGDKSKSEPIIENFRSALESQQVGMVFLDKSSGFRNKLSFNDGYYSTSKADFNNEYDKEIILKIDGDLVYKYTESFYENEKSVKVILSSKSQEIKESEETMRTIKFTTQGDRLVGSLIIQPESDTNDGELTISGGTSTINISIAKDNMLCDSRSTISTKGSVLRTSLQTLKLLDEYVDRKGSCPESLPKSELKKIDLSNITFCDESAGYEDINCENKDMRFLTSDF